jgi:small membrane protein
MTLILPIQLILLVFIIFAASRAFIQFRGGTIRFAALSFWLLIWVVAIIAIFFPGETTALARVLGIGRGVDVIIYSSIAILFYLVFRLHVYLEDIRSQLSSLIREVSLKEVKKGQRK